MKESFLTENLLFIDFSFFLEDYESGLVSLGFEENFLSFVMQHERPYIQKLYDSLAESYGRGVDAFYYHESKIEQLVYQCVEYRLLGYKAQFEREKDAV
ncbi:hypothetical protein HB818_03805 [Listeria booriae]|uniref:hypothetical protein n=1 Tax=Listeria booriae TaxID=1552123 RepID=UPI00162AA13A|nr:hypothetical protein [Listeria booriae]MBC1284889.1 hypothetical protein [Listeria booriae]